MSHQPFHWLAEFYEIIVQHGGFDVIIGNPPYVAIKKVDYVDETFCTDLYGFVIKRVFSLKNCLGRHGFIVMHNLAFSRDFKELRTLLKKQAGSFWFSFYGRIPSGLFSGDVRVRSCIYIYAPQRREKNFTTRLHRWFSEYRNTLFHLIRYTHFEWKDVVPMFNSQVLADFFNKVPAFPIEMKQKKYGTPIYFKKIGYNWITVTEKGAPCYDGKTGKELEQSELGTIYVEKKFVPALVLFFCGKMFFTYWLTYGDEFHVTRETLLSFYPNLKDLSEEEHEELGVLYALFSKRLDSTLSFKLNAGKRVGTYQTASLWDLTDKSDLIFLKHLADKPEIIREAIEENVVESVVTGKKDSCKEVEKEK